MLKRLQGELSSDNDVLRIIETVENDMLVVLDESDNQRRGVHDSKNLASSASLQATPDMKRGRKSLGNIARDLGAVLSSLND